jgi:ribosome-binding factor A
MNSHRSRAERTAKAGHRLARLEHVLFEEVDALFRGEISDPRVQGVIVTRLRLSPDGRNAHVWFKGPCEAHALASLVSFLRARLAAQLDMKRVPEIHFVEDPFLGEEDPPCA